MGDFKAPAGQQNKIATPVQAPKGASSLGETEYVDSRASTFQFIQLQAAADDQGKGNRITQLQSKSAQFTGFSRVAQLQAKSYSQVSAAQPSVVQREENKTGLPDGLKSGMESISGMSLSDVKVHRNSDKPAQLQAHAYAQGTDIHLGPGQEKHLPHELGHVVQQKEGRVRPTVQLKGKININDDSGLEKEADVLGQKANSVGESTEKGSEVGVAQQKGEDVLQGKFTQGSLPQFSKAQPIQLEDDGKAAAAKNNVTKEQIDKVRPIKDQPLEEIKKATGLTEAQIATAQARLFGDVKVLDKQKVDPKTGLPVGETPKLRAATPWDKLVEANLTEESKSEVEAAKIKIPEPKEFFGGEAGIKSHLGKFANGVHAFITPILSQRILGTASDWNFDGWGKDYNFVTPLSVGEEIHKKAVAKDGIITLEEELGLAKWDWVKDNPKKQMVRWIIPKPTDFDLPGEKFLSVATGNETGAIIDKWVAGGYTLGGVPEAVFKAIPREKLLFVLKEGQILNPTVEYPNTPDYPKS
jgi:hypothetical protein